MQTAPPAAPMPPTTWFGRNWKWVVPVGCLLPVLVLGGFALAMFFCVTGVLKQSDANKTALARAQTDPALVEGIGSPVWQTGIVSRSSNVNGPTGEANLSAPLSGSKGKATLYVEATKSADVWLFRSLAVKIETTGKRIDLNLAGYDRVPTPPPSPRPLRSAPQRLEAGIVSQLSNSYRCGARIWVAHASRVLVSASRRNSLSRLCELQND